MHILATAFSTFLSQGYLSSSFRANSQLCHSKYLVGPAPPLADPGAGAGASPFAGT